MIAFTFELFWVLAFIVAFWHLAKKKSVFDALIFLVPAVLWGYFAEYFGVHIWHLYVYPESYFLNIFGVPIVIALGWATIIYFGYFLTSELLHVRKILNIDVESAFISTLIDFVILEPFAFIFKLWIWNQNDFWFGAPLINFVGWFLVITIYLMTYQFITTKFKEKNKQALYFVLALIPAFIILELLAYGYLMLFGWF